MIQYMNATRNADEYVDILPFPIGYQPQEIEVFFGDSPIDSAYHYKNGEWIALNLENIGDEPVLQILIDDQWTFIQAGSKVLLDRLGGVQLPLIPNQEHLIAQITQTLRK